MTTAVPDGQQPQERLLLERQEAFLQALATKDLEETAAHFAENAMLHVANMPAVEGRGALREFDANVFQGIVTSRATPERWRASRDGELAYTTGRVTNVFQTEGGPMEFTGKYLLVGGWHEGEWLIEVYSVSSNDPAPGG